MFKSVMKVTPKIDKRGLDKMERSLSQRFKRVANGFSKGFAKIFKGGAFIGAALAFVDKLLSPIKEVNEALERTLQSNDSISTFAAQLNTTAGKLQKLQAIVGTGTGLTQDKLLDILTKFQLGLAEERKTPGSMGLKDFTEFGDVSDAFFSFIQSMKSANDDDKNLVTKRVFGDEGVKALAEAYQIDVGQIMKQSGLDKVSFEALDKSIEKIAALSNMSDALKAGRQTRDIIDKARVLNEGIIRSREDKAALDLKRENERFKSYQNLQNLTNTVDNIFIAVEGMVAKLGEFIGMATPWIKKVGGFIDETRSSSWFKGLFKWGGK